MSDLLFKDRRDAGRALVGLERYRGHDDVIVLGLPRGGVPTPSPFFAVGQSYWDFTQTSDREVRELLAEARQQQRAEV